MKKWGIVLAIITILGSGQYGFARMPVSFFPKIRHRAHEGCISYERRGILKEITHHHLYLFGEGGAILRFKLAPSVKVVFSGPSPEVKVPGVAKERCTHLREMALPIPPGTKIKVVGCLPDKRVIKIIIEELPR